MADPTAKTEALKEASVKLKDVLIERTKTNAALSLKLGVGVSVVAFGLLTTIVATNLVIGAGEGVVEGIKNVRKGV